MVSKKQIWQINTIVSAKGLPFFEKVFDEIGDALLASEIETGEQKGKWNLEAICEKKPDLSWFETSLALAAAAIGENVPSYDISSFEDKNWLLENLQKFNPIEAGRYYIYGSHIKENPPLASLPLQIDAATAFGSGRHATTCGCLLALDKLAKKSSFKPENILDMGCGTGILGLAAAKTYKKKVLAVDIDKESVRVAQNTARKNYLAKFIKAELGNGYKKGSLNEGKTYDLIFANILARPLTLMAKDLRKYLSVNGLAILSGLLCSQEQWVLSTHRQVGLYLVCKFRIGEWSTLVVGKNRKIASVDETKQSRRVDNSSFR